MNFIARAANGRANDDQQISALEQIDQELRQFAGGDSLREFRRLLNQHINEMRNAKVLPMQGLKALRIVAILEGGRTFLKLLVSDPRFPSNEQIFGTRIAEFISENDLGLLNPAERERALARKYGEYVNQLAIDATAAGFTVLQPVWLVDPAV